MVQLRRDAISSGVAVRMDSPEARRGGDTRQRKGPAKLGWRHEARGCRLHSGGGFPPSKDHLHPTMNATPADRVPQVDYLPDVGERASSACYQVRLRASCNQRYAAG